MEQSLGELLSQKERERQELVPEQKCLFCKTILRDERRHALMAHLWEVHHFKIGHPDNLVYIDAFIGALRRRLEDFTCLFCDKQFPDFNRLRLHMRKKQHLKIDGRAEYDRFYLCNYVGPGQRGQAAPPGGERADEEDEDEQDDEEDDGNQWESWVDDSGAGVACLVCSGKKFQSSSVAISHMLQKHNYDLLAKIRQWRLDFFGRIRFINYCRKAKADESEAGAFDIEKVTPADFQDLMYLIPWDENDELLRHEFDLEFDEEEAEAGTVERRRLSV